MTETCQVCLQPVQDSLPYHGRCCELLFSTESIPTLAIETGMLHTAALAMVGHVSLSGVQRKVSLNVSADNRTLRIATGASQFILKPEVDLYPAVPENEHVTNRMAELVGIQVSSCGLIELRDGSKAFLARRFDRLPNGRKLRQEDFCQLMELSPKQKYDSSAERCVKVIQRFASEPLIETLKFYRLMLFAWWSGNGDMHLKNFSLIAGPDGLVQLTPAYDLVSTRLIIPDDPLALPILGKRDRFNRQDWLRFAGSCRLSAVAAERVLETQIAALPAAKQLLERSFLPEDQRQSYTRLIEDRTAAIAA